MNSSSLSVASSKRVKTNPGPVCSSCITTTLTLIKITTIYFIWASVSWFGSLLPKPTTPTTSSSDHCLIHQILTWFACTWHYRIEMMNSTIFTLEGLLHNAKKAAKRIIPTWHGQLEPCSVGEQDVLICRRKIYMHGQLPNYWCSGSGIPKLWT